MLFPIEVLLTENELADEFVAALKQRYLPEKFFYWFPLSVKAWLELCQLNQPYKNFSRSYELVSQHACDIARPYAGTGAEVVSLGAGQGDKDLLLLEALRQAGAHVRYRPVDASQALLELAVKRATEAGFSVSGLKADLAASPTAATLTARASQPRLYLVLGNTLGAIDPLAFLETLRRLLCPADRLLVDGEIFDPRDTMAGYENPVNRRFAFAPLASIGLEEPRDGRLVFETDTDSRRAGLHRVTKHFRAARPLEIAVAGRRVPLAAGEKIAMNCSYKYTRAAFLALLEEKGGASPVNHYLSADEHFLLVFAAPRSG